MIKVSVTYPNQPGARFDHDYYRTKHVPPHQEQDGRGLEILHHRQGAHG